MQVYFFAKYCLKRLISPTTNQNEHPRVQNNQNLALHGTKRDPIWAKRTPKWAQRVPKGRQKWARNQQKYHKKSQPRKRSKKGGARQHLLGSIWIYFWSKMRPKIDAKNYAEKHVKKHEHQVKNKARSHPQKWRFSNCFCKGGSSKIAFLLKKNNVCWRSRVWKVWIHLKNIRGESKQKHSSNKYVKNM